MAEEKARVAAERLRKKAAFEKLAYKQRLRRKEGGAKKRKGFMEMFRLVRSGNKELKAKKKEAKERHAEHVKRKAEQEKESHFEEGEKDLPETRLLVNEDDDDQKHEESHENVEAPMGHDNPNARRMLEFASPSEQNGKNEHKSHKSKKKHKHKSRDGSKKKHHKKSKKKKHK